MAAGLFGKLRERLTKAKTVSEAAEEVAKEYSEQDFLSDLKWTNKAYLVTVIVGAVLVAAAIAVAVIWQVFYGLMLAIMVVIAYIGATGKILYSRLGFSYDSLPGALKIKDVYGKDREQVFVPRRLFWLEVSEIGDKAFCHRSSAKLTTVYLPRTLKTIGENAFEGCDSLCRICFEGSEREWESIEKNTSFEGIEILFGQEIAYPVKEKKPKKQKKEKKKKERQEGEQEGK
jgi:hypothetical protein